MEERRAVEYIISIVAGILAGSNLSYIVGSTVIEFPSPTETITVLPFYLARMRVPKLV